ncbi:MAG: putative rane protein, partial [Belnapia sp.]|nr:putative rane protein [Belnapia sp.]
RRRPAADRPNIPWPDQAPAALAAGGVAILFGATYAAGVMYALLPPLLGFALLALVALGGIALALLFGPVVAAVGIAGAYLTPALVETADPSLPGLFLYLLAVTAAALVVLRQVGAAWLGWCATFAAAAWVVAGDMIAGGSADLWSPALFAPAAAALHVFLLPPAALDSTLGRRLVFLPFAVLAAALLVMVPGAEGLAPACGILLFSVAGLARAMREPRLVLLPWVAALAGLLLLLGWTIPGWLPADEAVTIDGVVQALLPINPWPPEALLPFLSVALLLAALHAAAGVFQERRAPNPVAWAALPAAVPVLVLLVAYARVRGFALDARWALAALALAGGLVGLATLAQRDTRRDTQRDTASQRAGAHAAGALAALALGAAMVLSDQWLTLAVALFLPPLAWVEGRSGLLPLRKVALAVAGLVLVRLLLNWNLAGYDFGTTPVFNGLLAAYGVPAASFALTAWMFGRRRDDLVVAVLEAGALVFTCALVVLEIRHAMTDGVPLDASNLAFREAALQLTALAMLATIARWLDGRLGGRPMLAWGWRLLLGLVVALGAWLVVENPTQEAGVTLLPWPVFNELALGYAVPAALVGLAVRAVGAGWFARILAGYALLGGFAWVTLEVRHHFHPVEMSLDLEPIFGAELYAYSGAWLGFGAALLALGIRQGVPALRLAALAAIGLTILKAVFVDMAELGGLWRVLSFLGLGLALIALGAVYRRFVVVTPAVPPQVPPLVPPLAPTPPA